MSDRRRRIRGQGSRGGGIVRRVAFEGTGKGASTAADPTGGMSCAEAARNAVADARKDANEVASGSDARGSTAGSMTVFRGGGRVGTTTRVSAGSGRDAGSNAGGSLTGVKTESKPRAVVSSSRAMLWRC